MRNRHATPDDDRTTERRACVSPRSEDDNRREAVGPEQRGSAYTPLRFPGRHYDPEPDLHYNYFRYYDPESARYLSPAPWGYGATPRRRSQSSRTSRRTRSGRSTPNRITTPTTQRSCRTRLNPAPVNGGIAFLDSRDHERNPVDASARRP
ncbi:hypothetical protein K4G64_30690 [Streptomyces sp. WAC04114]|nr:hypothetical protein [Streptomyces sp. WAC04114]